MRNAGANDKNKWTGPSLFVGFPGRLRDLLYGFVEFEDTHCCNLTRFVRRSDGEKFGSIYHGPNLICKEFIGPLTVTKLRRKINLVQ